MLGRIRVLQLSDLPSCYRKTNVEAQWRVSVFHCEHQRAVVCLFSWTAQQSGKKTFWSNWFIALKTNILKQTGQRHNTSKTSWKCDNCKVGWNHMCKCVPMCVWTSAHYLYICFACEFTWASVLCVSDSSPGAGGPLCRIHVHLWADELQGPGLPDDHVWLGAVQLCTWGITRAHTHWEQPQASGDQITIGYSHIVGQQFGSYICNLSLKVGFYRTCPLDEL